MIQFQTRKPKRNSLKGNHNPVFMPHFSLELFSIKNHYKEHTTVMIIWWIVPQIVYILHSEFHKVSSNSINVSKCDLMNRKYSKKCLYLICSKTSCSFRIRNMWLLRAPNFVWNLFSLNILAWRTFEIQ